MHCRLLISARPLLLGALLTALAALPSAADPPVELSSDAPPESAVLADLPMLEVPGSPLIHLDLAAPGDPPLRVILDTGSHHSVAGRRGLQEFGGEKRPGDREIYHRRTATGGVLTVAPVPDRAPQVQADPFVRLGLTFLRGYVLELDFSARRVRFLDPDRVVLPEATEAPDEAVIQLGPRPAMDVDVNGHPVNMLIDTTLPVPLWLKTRDLVKSAISPKTLPILRVRGERQATVRLFETDLVKLGPLDAGVFPVIVSQDPHRDAFGQNGHAVGIDLLSRFRVRLDIARSRMWLKRAGDAPVRFAGLPYSRTSSSGAYLTPFGSWYELFGVLPDSPAATLGLQPGDRIDPEQIGVSQMVEVLEMIRQQSPLLVHRPGGRSGGYEQQLLPDAPPPGPAAEGQQAGF
jgi:hypothetical protein